MAETNEHAPSPWPTMVFLGVLCGLGVALGAIAVYFLRGRRDAQLGIIPERQLGALPQQVPPLLFQHLLPPAPFPASRPESQALSMDSKMQSFSLSPKRVSKLFYAAGENPWTVHVSNGGPAGSFAYISNEPSSLNPGFISQANVAGLPAGGSAPVRLQPGQDLYAISNVAGVVVSIIASQDPFPPNVN